MAHHPRRFSAFVGVPPLPGTIKAVTFDLWDTIVDDDSDEPRRRARGLRPKAAERPHLIREALDRHEPLALDTVTTAYRDADAAFVKAWKERSITWTLDERLDVVLRNLGRDLDGGDRERLIEALGAMEVDIPPDPIPGVAEMLANLAGRYKLSIVSDAIVTPGSGLRRLLENHGLKQYFTGFAFSDEVGRSKPHREMFSAAAGQMGVEIPEMVHVGDRDHNDVKGPQALGMKAVLFTATRADDRDVTSADAVCDAHAELPAIIDRLAH